MSKPQFKTALIVGTGSGLSASLARRFAEAGLGVGFAARNKEKLKGLADETGGTGFACDATKPSEVARLFDEATQQIGEPDVVIYNAAPRVRGPVAEIDPVAVAQALDVSAYGGFLVGQQAARRMLGRKHGAIFFTGATASVKGFANSGSFAMGKFALRGLAQSMARELAPNGIHVAHFVIDGGICAESRSPRSDRPDSLLDPDAIAQTYFDILLQPRSAWTCEVELRPWIETF